VTRTEGYIPNWQACRSELVIPLKVDARVIGVIDIQSAEPAAFTSADERMMSLFADRAAISLENARLFREAKWRLERVNSLRRIDRAVAGSLDLNVILDVLLNQLLERVEVDADAILLYEKANQMLTHAHGLGFRTAALQHTNLRLGQGYAGKAALERRYVFIPDLSEADDGFAASSLFAEEEFVTYYGIPLVAKGILVGVLEVFRRAALDSTSEWVDYLHIVAGQAAIAIDNVQLFDNLQRSNMRLTQAYDATIEGWAKALELRDMETEGHSRRVVGTTMELARRMGIRPEKMADIRRGALLHDIGKMGVPDSILQKPGKLSEEEWQVMRKHPLYAYQWLASIDYLRPALNIPYCHHEKWDGTGYPRQLKGEQIPLEARVFAVVDVWDALCSDRPYRKAWSEQKTLEYIQNEAGKHFDPQVVRVFTAYNSECLQSK
ncbi:MAG: GAF domain-containing protein, partial [Anaerolineales bacterium]|nr:GAF domain-containing protein [Anaerolineales bacterium]